MFICRGRVEVEYVESSQPTGEDSIMTDDPVLK